MCELYENREDIFLNKQSLRYDFYKLWSYICM
jgi:hypothetical protein